MKNRLNSIGMKISAILAAFGLFMLAVTLLASSVSSHIEKELPLLIHLNTLGRMAFDLKTLATQYLHSGSRPGRDAVKFAVAQWEESLSQLRRGGSTDLGGESVAFEKIDTDVVDSDIDSLQMEWNGLRRDTMEIVEGRESVTALYEEFTLRKTRIPDEVYRLVDRLETFGPTREHAIKLSESLITHNEKIHGYLANLFVMEGSQLAQIQRASVEEILAIEENIVRWLKEGNAELNVPPMDDATALPLLATLRESVTAQRDAVNRLMAAWISLLKTIQCMKDKTSNIISLIDGAGRKLGAHHIAELKNVESTAMQVLVLTLVLTLLAILATNRYLIRPLTELSNAAKRVAAGDLKISLKVRTSDEVGILTENFQKMAHQLDELHGRLIQTSRLSTLGVMTAGIAHEINNPLAGIMGFAQLILMRKDLDPTLKHQVESILEQGERCKRIVQQLLQFSRRDVHERQLCRVNEIIFNSMAMREHQMKVADIAVEYRLADNLPQIIGDAHQLQQVFINVINNAFDALLDVHDRPRKLTVATSVEAGMVSATFTDSGPGIAREHLDKIFDPFFTTKEVGKGTGLGMSISYGIIKAHHGVIRIKSAPGAGTTIVVDLPSVKDEGESPKVE